MRVEIEFRLSDPLPITVGNLLPRQVLNTSETGIGKMRVGVAGHELALNEIARIKRDSTAPDELVFSGDVDSLYKAGWRMDGGRMIIAGDAGRWVGAEMSAGEIVVHGSAGDCLGVGMHGGTVTVNGDAGDWCGANQAGRAKGMDGGTIIVRGSAAKETGTGMRCGLICISGDAGDYTGADMLAGTILVGGTTGKYAGVGLGRGSILTGKIESVLPGFNPAGSADLEWIRLALTMLSKMGIHLPKGWTRSAPLRFTGDHLVAGKGELITYELA